MSKHPNPVMHKLYGRMRWERRLYAITIPFRRVWCKIFGHNWILKMDGSYCDHGCGQPLRKVK